MASRMGDTGLRAGMSKGLYIASCMVFKKIHESTTLSHHLFSIPAEKTSSVKEQEKSVEEGM